MLCGPPWMCSCIGYFFVGSKSGGVMYQPWIFRPSTDVYQISFDVAELLAGEDVVVDGRQLLDCAGFFRSKVTMSPGFWRA